MNRDDLGPVGGLAADRPLIVNLVLAFGLTALAAAGVESAGADDLRPRLADFMFAAIAMSAIPLALAGASPARLPTRIAFAVAVIAFSAAYVVLRPVSWLALPAASTPAIFASAGLAALYILSKPVIGAPAKLGVVAAFAAILGAAGAASIMSVRGGDPAASAGAAGALALAVGSATGVHAIADFASAFARGKDRREAAGAAAQDGAASALYNGMIATAALFLIGGQSLPGRQETAILAGGGVLIAAMVALLATAGALALRRSSEVFAAEENRRRQSFRAFWKPIRAALAPSAAFAAVAIMGVAVVAAAFGWDGAPSLGHMIFMFAASALAGLIFFSLRVGALVFFMLLTGDYLLQSAWPMLAGSASGPMEDAVALACAAVGFGQLAVAWREARSPRLNARETTEAAMSAAFGPYVLSAVLVFIALYAGGLSGFWEGGATAAGKAGVLLIFGIVAAPPVMTALSSAVRRELA